MAERGVRLKLGGFVAGMLAVLAGLVLFFGRTPELFLNRAEYGVLYPEAPGIDPGAPIRKSGIRIGEVVSVELDPNSGRVRVVIRVDRKYLPRKSEEAHITRGILSGDTAIDFIPRLGEDGQPVPRGEEWPPGSDIPGVPPITPRTLLTPTSNILSGAQQSLERIVRAFEKLERLESIQPKLEQALDEASETFRSLRTLVPEAKKTLERIQNFLGPETPERGKATGEPGFLIPAGLATAQPDQPNLRNLIQDVQELARAIKPVVEDIRGLIKRLEPEVAGAVKSARQTFDNVNEVLSPENRKQFTELIKNVNAVATSIVRITNLLSGMLDGAEKTLKTFDALVSSAEAAVGDIRAITKPLAARADALVAGVTESADQLAKAIAEVRELLATFARGNGTVQRLLADPGLYQSIDEAANSLARILARAERITRDLEVFADKIARRPEIIGIGGVVRPSSGLKDLPGAGVPTYRPDWPPATTARPPVRTQWPPPQTEGSRPPSGGPPPAVQGYPPR